MNAKRVAAWRVGVAAFALLVAGQGFAQGVAQGVAQQAPPIEHYTKPALLEAVVPSPSGKRMAFLFVAPNGRRRLGVVDLVPKGTPRLAYGFDDLDIERPRWVNENRLVFEAFEEGAVMRENAAGVFAVDHDGTGYRPLIVWRWRNDETESRIRSKVLPYGWFLHSTVDDGSDDVFVYRVMRDGTGEHGGNRLARLNTSTGELKRLSVGMPEHATSWVMDHRKEPRVLGAQRKDRYEVYWRNSGSDEWTRVENFDAFKREGFSPEVMDADGTLYVTTGADHVGLHVYDPKARKLDPEPALAVKGFDLDPTFQVDSRTQRVVGLHFRADRPMSYWFDDRLDALQRGLDKELPGRNNRIYCGQCDSSSTVVVHSSSDRDPGRYYMLHRDTARLEPIDSVRPWIDEKTQGRRTFHRIEARDGLSMPVYVTHPPGASETDPLPAVVLVHGGPFVRGVDLQWDAEAQFLASRGYRVIEPEFRGSMGYGTRHFRAGWKQWGLAMQDDVADAVQWAAKQRLVDPARVCIMGTSYGGYAALMGPIRHPGQYRCAVSYAGVTDLELMHTLRWSDMSDVYRDYGFPALVGDPEKDQAMLRASSPLRRVAEIKVPVLLAHGERDRRVPIEHARQFVSAARSAGVPIEHVYYDEGHGWFKQANHADFYGRLEKFLAKSLAPK
jgi:dipeptidyl aminopeptidase/acylaminoacyl peptidase